MGMRFQRNKNSGDPILKEGASPNPSTKNFLNMLIGDAEVLRSKQPSHIQKVFADGGLPRTAIRGPAERSFSKRLFPRKSYSLGSLLV